MNPLIEWFCQPVALAISAIVAPSVRRKSSKTMAVFVVRSSLDLALAILVFFPPAFAFADFFVAALCPSFDFLACRAGAVWMAVVASSAFILVLLLAVDPRLHIHH